MGENREQPVITADDMRRGRAPVEPQTTANILRQQSGVEVTIGGKPLATDGVQKQQSVKTWLTGDEIKQAGLPEMEIVQEEDLATSVGLVGLDQKLHGAIRVYLEQDPTGQRKSFKEIFGLGAMDKRSIPYGVKLTLAKVNTLLGIEGLGQPLVDQLEQIKEFYEQDLVPQLNLTAEENRNLEEEIDRYLRQPRATIDESYAEKAKRALLGLRGERGQRFIGGVAKDNVQSLPIELWEQTLALATTVNHLRLLERLEHPTKSEDGINLVELKVEISAIMEELSKIHEVPSFQELREQNGPWNRMAMAISVITNAIAKEFPHDTVYLLGQALDKGEAVCAGKAMMATMLLRDMGLQAEFTKVMVRVDSNNKGEHALTHVRFPNVVRLALDMNYPANFYRGLDQYEHLAGWLVPTGEVVTELGLAEEMICDAPNSKLMLLRINEGFVVFKHEGGQHRLVSENSIGQPEFSVYNLANLFSDNAELFAADFGGDKNAVIREAARLYGEATRINLKDDTAYNNRATLLDGNPQLFAADFGGDTRAVIREAARLYGEAIRINPRNSKPFNNRAILLAANPELFAADFGGDKNAVIREAYRLYGEAIRIDPEDDKYLSNRAVLLVANTQLFAADFGGDVDEFVGRKRCRGSNTERGGEVYREE